MAYLYSKTTRKILLSLILIWGVGSFWLLNHVLTACVLISIAGFISLFLVWFESLPVFLLIFLGFISAYALSGFLYQYGLPVWLIMISILIIFGYLFTYFEQKTGILGNRRLIYLLLFSIVTVEVFFGLSYFLINPLSQSLIIATVCYMFTGFCYTILAQQEQVKIGTYLWIGGVVIATILLSSTWSV